MKCQTKREIKDPEPTFTKTGTPATKGTCPVCGTGLFRMGRTDAHEGMEIPEEILEAKRKRKEKKRQGRLVIVESPAKARTVGRILGKEYRVKASVGHVRDLLRSKLSVDVENDFEPRYRVPNEKRDVVKELKADAGSAAEIFLATDPDREGEAIAWHLLEAADIESDLAKRVVFHEITKPAITEAFGHPRGIDMNLVDAQQARRILDRLVGYNLSPLLWSKVRSRLSAGRVQSVALRLVVEREQAIRDFEPEEYWSLDGEFLQPEKPPAFRALLMRIDDEKPELSSKDEVDELELDLQKANYRVSLVRWGSRRRNPNAPFTTSTMQQDASRRLNFSARRTMAVAQQLYEGLEGDDGEGGGLITYMRTDSTQVSKQAQQAARNAIKKAFGEDYVPGKPPVYETKSRSAQEAHEAIRPTNPARHPDHLKGSLTKQQHRLYELIWQRFMASQMKPAVYDTLRMEVDGESSEHAYLFRVSASSLRFPGFLAAYGDGDEGEQEDEGKVAIMDQLPELEEGDPVDLIDTHPEQHFTQPPARFSEATLVRELEENGIGRPSTYAPIITTLQQRGYVHRQGRRLHPTEIGETVNGLLVDHFPDIVDLGFTARLEEELDEVAEGDREWVDVVSEFYEPFSERLEAAAENMPELKPEPEHLDRECPECGHNLMIRHGRYGKFIGCSNFPDCRYTEPWLEKIGVTCPEDGGDLVERRTRKGRVFYGCANYPECEFTSWKRPLPAPCPNCGGMLVAEAKGKASCIACEQTFDQESLEEPEADLA
ncbi:MAG: type I DNA topoisomerase [Anaerolineales bacterium]